MDKSAYELKCLVTGTSACKKDMRDIFSLAEITFRFAFAFRGRDNINRMRIERERGMEGGRTISSGKKGARGGYNVERNLDRGYKNNRRDGRDTYVRRLNCPFEER